MPAENCPDQDQHEGEWSMAAEETFSICLDQFLKFSSTVGTGGQAKLLIREGSVRVNGEIETRRRRKLHVGDIVEVDDQRLVVESGIEP